MLCFTLSLLLLLFMMLPHEIKSIVIKWPDASLLKASNNVGACNCCSMSFRKNSMKIN